MKRHFSSEFPTLLIDATSPSPPRLLDLCIPNSYYPGLWNAAVQAALERGFGCLFFIASDVDVKNCKRVSKYIEEAIQDSAIGIYSPSLSRNSRAAFKTTLSHKTNRLRRCGLVEGFTFRARLEILQDLYPIPSTNKYGWIVDIVACEWAKQRGCQVVVDDRVTVAHPKSKTEHQADEDVAYEDGIAYAESMGLSRESCELAFWAVQKPSYKFLYRNLSMRRSLDLGCGVSPNNIYSADDLYGIDLSPRALKEGVEIRAVDLTFEPIPWPCDFFDVITAFDFIEHVPRLAFIPERRYPFINLMNEIWRCLKPDGIFHSLTSAYPAKRAFQDPTHVNIITEDTFRL